MTDVTRPAWRPCRSLCFPRPPPWHSNTPPAVASLLSTSLVHHPDHPLTHYCPSLQHQQAEEHNCNQGSPSLLRPCYAATQDQTIPTGRSTRKRPQIIYTKTTEVLKEYMNKFMKEIQEKTNNLYNLYNKFIQLINLLKPGKHKLEEINKSLKESKKK